MIEDTATMTETASTPRRPPTPKARAKKHLAIMSLRLPPSDLERIRADAAAAGLSVSEVVRRRYFGIALKARVDHQAISELRRLGGLVKHFSGSPNAAWRPEAHAALNAIASAVNRIGEATS